ncbi:MAG: EI24 domain-containing protein [Bacteroidales bacterium]|nr:EI24 domain-containing protein [Bacteroidales bacterium]
MGTQTKQKKIVIPLEERTFGDMIGIPFAFIFQEFKGIILSVLKYAGPLFAFAILLGVIFLKDAFNDFPLQGGMYSQNQITLAFILVWLIFILAIHTIIAVTYNYISVYEKHGKGNFTIKDVGDELFPVIFKILGASVIFGVLSVLAMFLLALIPVIGILLYFVGMSYLSVNLSLFPFIIAHEKVGIRTAFSRSFKLIKGKWWFSFGLYILFFIIIYFTMYAAMIPLVLVGVITPLAGLTSGGGMVVMIILFAVIIFFVYIMLIAAMNTLFSFQYFNLLARKEGVNLSERISAINDGDSETKGNIFEVNENNISNEQEEQNKKDEEINKEEDEPKTEDEWSKLIDNSQKKNRFEEDDENDRFKPKY